MNDRPIELTDEQLEDVVGGAQFAVAALTIFGPLLVDWLRKLFAGPAKWFGRR